MGKIETDLSGDWTNYDICKNQGKIYESAAEKGLKMELFSDKYLRSNFCNKSFDKIWSLYHFTDAEECLYELREEIGDIDTMDGDMIFSPEAAWWIGFTYKQLQIETEKSSEELAKIVSFDELCLCYPGLHTVDEEYATDMICEKHNLHKV